MMSVRVEILDVNVLGFNNNFYKEKGFNFYDECFMGGKWIEEWNFEVIKFFFEVFVLCYIVILEGIVEDFFMMCYRVELLDEVVFVVVVK